MTVVACFVGLMMLLLPLRGQQVLTEPQVLEDQARKLLAERKFEEAKAPAERALTLLEGVAGPRDPALVGVLRVLGVARIQTRDFDGAARDLTRAASILRTSSAADAPRILSGVLNNLGQVHLAQNRWLEADTTLTEALAVLQKANAPPEDLAGLYNTLGGFLLRSGDHERAGPQFARAAELWSQVLPPGHANFGNAFNNLGLVAQFSGRYEEARSYYLKALAIREQTGDPVALGRTLNNLGSALQEEGNASEAEVHYRRAIAIYEKAGAPAAADLGQALANLAVALFAQKEHERAAPVYRRALELRESTLGAHHAEVAASLTAYAIFLQATGQPVEALRAQARATDIIERNLELMLEVGSDSHKERALRLFAENVDIALWMRSVAAENPDANASALLTVLRRKGRLQEVLASSSAALRTASDGRAVADIDRLAAARGSLARELLAGGASAAQQARIVQLETTVYELEAALGRVRHGERGQSPVTIEAITRALSPGAVLIEVFRYRPFDPSVFRAEGRFKDPRYVVYALEAGRAPRWIELGGAAAIDEASAAFRSALLNPRRADVAERGAALRPLLTASFERLAGSAKKIYLAPDGDLNLLPFHALVGEDRQFLVDRYDITYLTGGRELLAPRSAARPGAAIVVGNPAFGPPVRTGGAVSRSFDSLPGADREARSVVALIPGASLLRGAGATEAAIKRVSGPVLLHVATHGFFLQGSGSDAVAGSRGFREVNRDAAGELPPLLRSGLAFAGANSKRSGGEEDGILTASEAALLDLRGTELVFLSACESGLGVVSAGESVYGLRRAFAIAGARSQVLTLWQVNDLATRRFVEDFYGALTRGARRDEALRVAQRAARADRARAHPFYWAAFILSGSDDSIVFSK